MVSRQPPDSGVTPQLPEGVGPTDATVVRTRVREGVQRGLLLSRHAKERMAENDLSLADIANILRGGTLQHERWASFEQGTWRYRFETSRMAVVIAEPHESGKVVIITAFRTGG